MTPTELELIERAKKECVVSMSDVELLEKLCQIYCHIGMASFYSSLSLKGEALAIKEEILSRCKLTK